MRVLVTRPEEDARSLVAALEARGHETLVEAMLTIAPAKDVNPPLDLTDIQALVFTSANGARAFARLSEARDLPVFAVGDASAAAARAAGFETVESAGGDVGDLAQLVIARLDPQDGALYQAAASRPAGDLSGALGPAGFTLRREALYEAKPVADLSATLRRELGNGHLDAATFFSPRTAETFVGLVEKRDLGAACAELTALALSEAVAAKLRALPWRDVLVAERPNQDALLARLDDLATGTRGAAMDETMRKGDAPYPAVFATARPDAEADTGARRIIARFGGIRPMAGKLAVAVSTVQGWRERDAIPARHHERVLAAARAHGVEIEPADLDRGKDPAAPPPIAQSRLPETARRGATEPKPEPKADPTVAAISEAGSEPRAEHPPERPLEPEPAPGPAIRARERPADGAAASARAWLGGAVLGALVFALGVAGAVTARAIWMPLIDPEYGLAGAGDPMALKGRVTALEAAQASRSAQGPAGVTDQSLEPLEQGLAGLGEDLKALESRLAALAATPTTGDPANAARLAELSARLEAFGALEERLDALPELATRIDQLSGRVEAISALEQRIDALAATPTAGDPASAARLAELSARLEAFGALEERLGALPELATRIDRLSGRVEAISALEQRIEALSALEGRVEALAGTNAEARAARTGEAALTLAVRQLSEALRGSGPFTEELAFLRDLAASGAIEDGAAFERLIAPLAPRAEVGIPSLEGLKAAFPAVARAVVVQSRSGAQGDWVAGALRRVSELVTLRPVGPVEGEGAGAVVARAEHHLEGDDLAAALSELAALQGPAAEAARAWRDEAAARLAARRALTGLGRMLLAQLGSAEG